MKFEDNLICIYDDSKDNITKILLDIYADFIESELDLLST